MDLAARLRLIAPFLLAGLLVPAAWALVVLLLPGPWTVKSEVLRGAGLMVLPSVAGTLLVGYALGLPHRVRPVLPEVDLPRAVGGLLLGLYLGALIASDPGGPNLVFPRDAGGLPVIGATGYALAAMALVGAVWTRPLVAPNGAGAATLTGLALVTSLPVALVLAWEGRLTPDLALGTGLRILAGVGGIGVLGVAAARLVGARWARLLTIAVVAGPALVLLVVDLRFLFVAVPLVILAAAAGADLLEPALAPIGSDAPG